MVEDDEIDELAREIERVIARSEETLENAIDPSPRSRKSRAAWNMVEKHK